MNVSAARSLSFALASAYVFSCALCNAVNGGGCCMQVNSVVVAAVTAAAAVVWTRQTAPWTIEEDKNRKMKNNWIVRRCLQENEVMLAVRDPQTCDHQTLAIGNK